jgi:hypothetical protein
MEVVHVELDDDGNSIRYATEEEEREFCRELGIPYPPTQADLDHLAAKVVAESYLIDDLLKELQIHRPNS